MDETCDDHRATNVKWKIVQINCLRTGRSLPVVLLLLLDRSTVYSTSYLMTEGKREAQSDTGTLLTRRRISRLTLTITEISPRTRERERERERERDRATWPAFDYFIDYFSVPQIIQFTNVEAII